ncbi:hypothetical protein PsorP6_006051 [Peronosclerospora sorghi]|uniref:Uncharacterized protein n=1 Tax=Peronosclerospora sorghi TaxID=230839 RepID=A0ACC0W770_9STRA|nr:hypothetical protein PsorP6_006051 [Peronosclerospora sorghi]
MQSVFETQRHCMGATSSRENEALAQDFIDRVTSENGVTIFSKSYCPYCNLSNQKGMILLHSQAKSVLDEAGVKYHVVELDLKTEVPTGADIQNALAAVTGNEESHFFIVQSQLTISLCQGRRTVPNVFIKKNSIGGGTDVEALYQSGKLTEMLLTAGAT